MRDDKYFKVKKNDLFMVFLLIYVAHILILLYAERAHKSNYDYLIASQENISIEENNDQKTMLSEDEILEAAKQLGVDNPENVSNIIDLTEEEEAKLIEKDDFKAGGGRKIINKIINKTKDINDIEEAKQIEKVKYVDTLSGDKIIINKDNQDFLLKLINVSEDINDINILKKTLSGIDDIYVEYDVMKEKDDVLYGYV